MTRSPGKPLSHRNIVHRQGAAARGGEGGPLHDKETVFWCPMSACWSNVMDSPGARFLVKMVPPPSTKTIPDPCKLWKNRLAPPRPAAIEPAMCAVTVTLGSFVHTKLPGLQQKPPGYLLRLTGTSLAPQKLAETVKVRLVSEVLV